MEDKKHLHTTVHAFDIIPLNSLVAAVPFPLVSGLHWEEVCRSLVLYSLWKAQQDSVVEVPHTGMTRRPERKGNRKPS